MNIFAYTEMGTNYPAYISINYLAGLVTITVRSSVAPDGKPGLVGAIDLTMEQYKQMVSALKAFDHVS